MNPKLSTRNRRGAGMTLHDIPIREARGEFTDCGKNTTLFPGYVAIKTQEKRRKRHIMNNLEMGFDMLIRLSRMDSTRGGSVPF